MRLQDLIRLVALAAIWGGSFIFLRVLSPVLGPIATTGLRLFTAGTVLIVYFRAIRFDVEWMKNWRHYLIIGTINSAIPFSLFAFAALHIPASYSVILNSTSPLFGAIFSAIWLGNQFTFKKSLGLLFGASGVALVTKVGSVFTDSMFGLSVAACIFGAACYGLAGIYIKKFSTHLKPTAIAGASQLMAGLLLLPLLTIAPIKGVVSSSTVLNILGLALLCSAIAYLLYYRLIADIGPTRALTVTFLMPVFGMLWGHIFLHEVITVQMLVGAALVIAGTHFVVRSEIKIL